MTDTPKSQNPDHNQSPTDTSWGELVLNALSGFDDEFIRAVENRDKEPLQDRDWDGVFD